jgi:hypothetical protein
MAQGVEHVMQFNLELEQQMVQEVHEQLLFIYNLKPEADPQFRELLQQQLEENIQRNLEFRQRRSQQVDRSLELMQRWGAENQAHQQWLQRQQQWQEQQHQQHQQHQQQGQRSELRTQGQQRWQSQLPGPPRR